MELAGLVVGVVGVLPVIVEVVEGYRIMVEVAHAKRNMANIGRDLSTEMIILQNTYERLLDGIVPAWELDTLTRMEPQTSKWQIYDKKIRTRLDRSFDDFQGRTEDIQTAVAELQQKLAIGSKGESHMKSWSSMVSEIRRRTRFTLKKKDYDDTIGRIRHGNAILQRLVEHNTTFETPRRARSQSNLARETRDLTRCLFFAIRNAMGCNCSTHGLGMQLAQKQPPEPVHKEGDKPRKGSQFDIILRRASHEEMQNWHGLSAHYNATVVAPSHVELQTSPSTSSNTSKGKSSVLLTLRTKLRIDDTRTEISTSKDKESKKNVRFSLPESSHVKDGTHTSTTNSPASGELQADTGSVAPIVSLCHMLDKGKSISNHSIGCIPNNAVTKFDLYHREYQPLIPRTITLREALLGSKSGLRDLEISERLHIAVALSFAVLNLCNTPWLKEVVTLDDIIFLCEGSALDLYNTSLARLRPFLVNQHTSTAHIDAGVKSLPSNLGRRPVNFHILSLGMLLTQIIAGHPTQELDIEEHMSKESLSSVRGFACKQAMTGDDASDNYVEAVQWCLDNSFTFATLEDEQLRQDFYEAVISRLERDLSYLS